MPRASALPSSDSAWRSPSSASPSSWRRTTPFPPSTQESVSSPWAPSPPAPSSSAGPLWTYKATPRRGWSSSAIPAASSLHFRSLPRTPRSIAGAILSVWVSLVSVCWRLSSMQPWSGTRIESWKVLWKALNTYPCRINFFVGSVGLALATVPLTNQPKYPHNNRPNIIQYLLLLIPQSPSHYSHYPPIHIPPYLLYTPFINPSPPMI